MEKHRNVQPLAEQPKESDLALIRKYAVTALTPEEVFVFHVALCDNEIDRDGERFDDAALEKLSKLFVGKSGIFDHSMKSRDQVARIFHAQVVSDGTKNSLGEDYRYVKADAYMLKSPENEALIREISAGIKKEVSVNCGVEGVFCSICGQEWRSGGCVHEKGKRYGGKLCYGEMRQPTDAYEWSFVAVPAQKKAGVVKSFQNKNGEKSMEQILKTLRQAQGDTLTLSREEVDLLIRTVESMKQHAADGLTYRAELEQETVRLGLISVPQLSADTLEGICKSLDTAQLRELKAAFGEEAGKHFPVNLQLSRATEEADETKAFQI